MITLYVHSLCAIQLLAVARGVDRAMNPFSTVCFYFAHSKNISYFIALMLYNTITRVNYRITVNYETSREMKSTQLKGNKLTIIHESNTILYSLYTLEDRKYTRVRAEVHRFDGYTEHSCLYGGFLFRFESIKTLAAGFLGPYCNVTENDPLIRGRNELTLSSGLNQILIYAYSQYFKINITFFFSNDSCEGIFNICDKPIIGKLSLGRDGSFSFAKQIYHTDSYEATYHAFYKDRYALRDRHQSIEITLITKATTCFNIQNVRNTESLLHPVHSCSIIIVPRIPGRVNLIAKASFRSEAVLFYHIKECGEIASFSQTNLDMSVTKYSLTYANTTAEAGGSHMDLHFGKRYCYDGLGGYSITVKDTINYTCFHYHMRADAPSTSYVECAVLTFPTLLEHVFSLRLIAHENDDRLPLNQAVSKSVYYYYITISQTLYTCQAQQWYFIGRVQLMHVLGTSCSKNMKCIVRGSLDELLQEDTEAITFRTYTKLLHFLVGRYREACPFTIGFSIAQYIVNTYAITDAHCTFQVS